MSFLRRVAGSFGQSQGVGSDSHWLARALGGGKTHAGASVSEYTALNITAVYSAVGILADLLGMLPLRVYQRDGERRSLVQDHPLVPALGGQANEYMTSFTLRQTSQGHASLWGNGYIEVEKNNKGEAVSLWPLLPDCTHPYRNQSGADSGIRYRTQLDGQSFSLPPDRVVHIKSFGHDGYCGLSPIALHRQALGMALATEEFGAKFFGNDAKSGGFLTHPGTLGDDAQKRLAESMNKKSGLDKAHRVRVLEEGMKFHQTTIPPEDAQFLGTREFQIAEIARIFRVPLVLLQSHEKSTAWGTGIEQFIIGFRSFTLQPWVRCWEDELNTKLFTASERSKGLEVRFALNELARGDLQSRAAYLEKLMQMGAITPDEVRIEEGYNPKDGLLDRHFISTNLRDMSEPDPNAEASRAMRNALSE